MSIHTLLEAMDRWPLAQLVRGDSGASDWLFPILESAHVAALALVFGTILVVDLRLLGLSARGTRVTTLVRELLPWTWGAWCLAAVFGALMFLSHPLDYARNLPFRLKFAAMALAGLNMLAFHAGAFRQVARWDAGPPPAAARVAGGVSLLCWTSVVLCGRLIGFTL